MPPELVHTAAQTARSFDSGKIQKLSGASRDPSAPGSHAYGAMQVRGEHIGTTVPDSDGTPFPIDESIKTVWTRCRSQFTLFPR